jgi:hypothetical protein
MHESVTHALVTLTEVLLMVYIRDMTPPQMLRAGLRSLVGRALDEVPAEIADGVFMPFSRYEGTTYIDAFEVKFSVRIVKRQAVCDSLNIRSLDGSPVTAVVLRKIPVAAMVSSSIVKMGTPFVLDDGKRVPVATQRAVDARAGERAKRTSREQVLPQVVQAYRAALANPSTRNSATQAVANQLGYQRGYISRLLSEARKMDPPLLGPAQKGKSGEWS